MSKPQLKFNCTQQWDEMTSTSCGKFCDLCQKEVIDFTGFSTSDLKAYFELKPNSCGVFNSQQVKVPNAIFPTWMKTFVSGLFIGTSIILLHGKSFGQANIGSPNKTEQNPTNHKTTGKSTQKVQLTSDGNPVAENKPEPMSKPKKVSRYYLSREFPFIHKRSKFRRLMGCPQF